MGLLASSTAAEIKCFLPRSVVYFLASNRTYVYICNSVRFLQVFLDKSLKNTGILAFALTFFCRFSADIYGVYMDPSSFHLHIYNSVQYIYDAYMVFTLPSSSYIRFNTIYIQYIYSAYMNLVLTLPSYI